MYANLTEFKIEASASGFISFTLKTDAMERAIRTVVTIDEALYMFDSLNGWKTYCPFFDDGIYLAKFSPHGCRLLHLDGGADRHVYGTGKMVYHSGVKPRLPWLHKLLDTIARWLETEPRPYIQPRWTGEYERGTFLQDYHIYFPLNEIACLVGLAISQARRFKYDRDKMERACRDLDTPSWLRPSWDYDVSGRTWTHTLRPETIAYLSKKYLPNIKYIFYGDALAGYKAALKDPRVSTDGRDPDLRAQFKSLGNIARNSSDGNLVTITIGPEHNGDAPLSFGWNIYDEASKRRIMNGGIIAHANRAADHEEAEAFGLGWPDEADEEYHRRPITGYSYSTHT